MGRINELQNAPEDEFWERFKAIMGGPDGLMTYRYLGTRADLSSGEPEGTMQVRRDMRNRAGGLLAAPLSIALADAGGITGDAAGIPAPVTSSVQLLDAGVGVDAVRVRHIVGHTGRTVAFTNAVVLDADDPDRLLALTHGVGVMLGSAPAGYEYVDPGPGVPDSPHLPPLHVAFGAQRHTNGGWQLPELTQRMGSTLGSLHHGPIQIVLEAAALELAAGTAGTDLLQIEQLEVQYVQRGKVGPFVSDGTASATSLGGVACQVRLTDEGAGNRLVATGTALFRRATGEAS